MHAGNDIHNGHYASELTGKLVEELTALCRDLNLDPPDVQLPERAHAFRDECNGAEQGEPPAEEAGTACGAGATSEPSGKE